MNRDSLACKHGAHDVCRGRAEIEIRTLNDVYASASPCVCECHQLTVDRSRSPHGSRNRYGNSGCRCGLCRQANTEAQRRYRAALREVAEGLRSR